MSRVCDRNDGLYHKNTERDMLMKSLFSSWIVPFALGNNLSK